MNVIKQRHLLDGNRVIVLLPQSLLRSADTLLIRNFGNHFLIGKLSVNNQSVESSGITKDYKDALCEYVWNSFEANATAVAIAVCSAVDDDVKARYDSQKSKGKKGLVAEIDNYEVYALTWDDVFQSFDLRHAFLLDKLKMDEEAIAAEIAQTAGDEKSKDTADALTALVAN